MGDGGRGREGGSWRVAVGESEGDENGGSEGVKLTQVIALRLGEWRGTGVWGEGGGG